MKTLYKINILLCFLAINFATIAQENQEQKRVTVEKNTDTFRMNYFSIDKNSFYVLEINVLDKKIVVDTQTKITTVPGKLPYPSGNLKVTVIDKNGEVIHNRFMQNPLEARSCEEGKDHIRILDNGRIYIPLPKSSNISEIILTKDKETVSRIDISSLFEDNENGDDKK